jgi:hypothetical protein
MMWWLDAALELPCMQRWRTSQHVLTLLSPLLL